MKAIKAIAFNKADLENVRELATRMWIDETRPTEVDSRSANVFYILKAFCELNGIPVNFDLNRKETGVVDDIN